ncbi:CDP-glycerol glycerophosphotransferase family protein [Microbacterium sp. 2216-1]|uniref:CDP-glycerol glycerophosphotransferase family protein n=1 Tax=Microbacterium sp. 2216-1 TaxID=3390053 RepID=UPI0039759086
MFRPDVIAAYTARVAVTAIGLTMRLLPRRNKVTLLSRQSNTPSLDYRMLHDAIRSEAPDVEVVVIARMVPPGLIGKVGYALHLVREIYHAETSRVLVIDGYSIVASVLPHSPGLSVVQTWHALGALKKFGLSVLGRPGGRDPKLAAAMRMHAGYDLIVASAERCRAPFADAFGTSIDRVVVAPLPRVDRLTDPSERTLARDRFLQLYPQLAGKPIAVYAPTFRTDGEASDPVALTGAFADIGYALVTKLHPLVPVPTDPRLITAPHMSTQDMLLVADVFITDYSSTLFEAAVAGVPCYLLAEDLTRFHDDRDFYLSYPDDLGIPLAHSVEELIRLMAAPGSPMLAPGFVDVDESGGATTRLAQLVLSLR